MLTGFKSQAGKEYKIMKNAHFWAVFVRVNYPSGDLAFWQQVSKNYVYRMCAVKNMVKRDVC